MPIQTARQAQEVFKTPRDLTRSSAGRVRSEITDLQRQPDLSKSETGRLKELRRDWNRNLKYTREGMALSGATSPLDAQNRFMRSTETFRQLNPKAYGRMYPLSQLAMQAGEYGGLLGMGVRALAGKFGEWGKGLTSLIDSDKDEQDEYIAKTFGPNQPFYPTDIHPGLPMDEEPLLVDEEPLLVDEEPGLTRREQIEQVLENPGIDTSAEFLLTPQKTDEELRQEQLLRELEENIVWSDETEEAGQPPLGAVDVTRDPTGDAFLKKRDELVEPLPFDEGKEDYIAASGMNPYLLKDEKLESIYPEDQRLFESITPHLDREIPVNIGVEFGDNIAPPPINYRDDPRTESGIANLMPGGPLYDAVPMAQRLRLMDTAKRLKEGQHGGMPLSYHGRNWFDEYSREMENEMEVNQGIRSPMGR